MAEVFLSYKSERRNAAEHVAEVLRLYGYSVWFDYQLIKGHDFGSQIDRKIREAKAAVVLWCSLSVASRWVAEEADLAYELGTLTPVKIEPCDPPVGFRRQDYIDLTTWNGDPRGHQLDPLIEVLEARVGRSAQIDLKGLRDYANIWRRFGAPSLNVFALGRPLASVEQNRHLPDPRRAARTESNASVQPPVQPRQGRRDTRQETKYGLQRSQRQPCLGSD